MNSEIILCLSDSQLTVYRYAAHVITWVNSYELGAAEGLEGFASWLEDKQGQSMALLLDVSSEDYYEEQLPHVRGRDRELLLSRKIAKFFPAEGFSQATLSTRLASGRRDDVYFLSGITDCATIDPLIDVLADKHIAIRGVYSWPQFAAELVGSIEHSDKVLLITCDADPSLDDRYIFRNTFVVNGKLYFSRKTSIATADASDIPGSVRKEIDRTWQYLNNRRVVPADSRMQVLMVLPRQMLTCLRGEPEASHCDYIYADVEELAQQHGYSSDGGALSSSSLGAFLLAKAGGRKTHYQPPRLGVIQRQLKIKRLLNVACIVSIALALVYTASNIVRGLELVDNNVALTTQTRLLEGELKLLREGFHYQGPAPQEMQDLVELSNQILQQSALPAPVFAVISEGLSGFEDLLLTDIEWRNAGFEALSGTRQNRAARQGGDAPQTEALVVVSLRGELTDFDGDFRYGIERIQLLISRFRADERVVAITAKRLPLDIGPAFKISRALSDQRAANFAIDVTLNGSVF
ncbi:hypothetical protein A9Q89_11190 [Gammaproteobacteria bacterium 53_120_T64]|nr:hypothetical protein A9Q89_11190 [Gammaproteobacteria bacterium 53_120_T64]